MASELSRTRTSVDFVGYERQEAEGRIEAIFLAGVRIASAGQGEEIDVVTDVTPFYGESGGQVGDMGTITGEGFVLQVTDTRRPSPEIIIHRAKVAEGTVREGQTALLAVDASKRRITQGNHTATHLLQAALRKVLGSHVKQAGSFVSPEKLRFDFTHFEAVPPEALAAVEEEVNSAVFSARPVRWEQLPYEEAVAAGAMAFFGEKYADVVRMVTVEGVSKELCGGTHVRNTADIGLFRLLSEGALAAGVRRIEAATGLPAWRHLREEAETLHGVARELKVAGPEVPERVRKLAAQIKALEKALQEARRRSSRDLVGEILAKAQEVGGVRRVAAEVEPMDPAALRELADSVKGKLGSGLLLLGAREGDRCHLVGGVTPDLTSRYSASDIVKKAAAAVGGGAGGARTWPRPRNPTPASCRRRSPRCPAGEGRIPSVRDLLPVQRVQVHLHDLVERVPVERLFPGAAGLRAGSPRGRAGSLSGQGPPGCRDSERNVSTSVIAWSARPASRSAATSRTRRSGYDGATESAFRYSKMASSCWPRARYSSPSSLCRLATRPRTMFFSGATPCRERIIDARSYAERASS